MRIVSASWRHSSIPLDVEVDAHLASGTAAFRSCQSPGFAPIKAGGVKTAAAGPGHPAKAVTGPARAGPLGELTPPAPVESGRDHADPKVAVLFKALDDDAPAAVINDVDGGRRGDRLDHGRRFDVD